MRDQVSRQKQFCTLKILVQRSNGGFIKWIETAFIKISKM
jgi:hypothetical protein